MTNPYPTPNTGFGMFERLMCARKLPSRALISASTTRTRTRMTMIATRTTGAGRTAGDGPLLCHAGDLGGCSPCGGHGGSGTCKSLSGADQGHWDPDAACPDCLPGYYAPGCVWSVRRGRHVQLPRCLQRGRAHQWRVPLNVVSGARLLGQARLRRVRGGVPRGVPRWGLGRLS